MKETADVPVEELSGRELDAAVAEDVFGAAVEWKKYAGRKHPYADRAMWADWCPTCGYDGHWDPRSVPPYSTDIAAAWEVVEWASPIVGDFIHGDGFFITMYADSADHSLREGCDPTGEAPGKVWSAHLHVGLIAADGDCPEHWEAGDTYCCLGRSAPEAICRAALKSVRGT